MNRRQCLTVLGGTLLGSSLWEIPSLGRAAETKTMVTVVKEAGVPWFNILNQGLNEAAAKYSIQSSMTGPATPDPAQQVKLIEDLIARKVDIIGLVPLDTRVTEQVVQLARKAGIIVITQEGPTQQGKTWDVELMSAQAYGEAQMKSLAREMGGEGGYAILVGTLTTTGHNQWADAAVAYQKAHFPKMHQVADRFPGADLIDQSTRVAQEILQTYPDIRGIISMGSNGPIGVGNVLRQRGLQKQVALVGTVIPSQAKPLIEAGVIREGFLWSPKDAGYAMVAVAHMTLSGDKFQSGMDVPGLGKATVDEANRVVMLDRILTINKSTIDGLVKQGL
jgi:simple sugar transport system substrate-binding protein